MSRGDRSGRLFFVLVAVVTVFFLAQQLGQDTPLFTHVLTARVVTPFASLGKLVSQILGCIYAARCAGRYEKGSAARPAWILMSAWLGCWFAGQVVLATYENVLHVQPPVPSAGDPFFFAGYAFLIAALFTFVLAYRASGFAVGGGGELVVIALAVCVVGAVVGDWLLVPLAAAPTPIGERLVNVGYPLLDMITLVPTVVLLRITVRFRGGRVWRVWGALLVGIVFATGGDLVFADISPSTLGKIGPLADLLFILGYGFCAYGTRLQYELVSD